MSVDISTLQMRKEAQRVKKLAQNHKVGSSRTGFKLMSIRFQSLYSCLLFYQMDSTSQFVCLFVFGTFGFLVFVVFFVAVVLFCIVFVLGREGWWQ